MLLAIELTLHCQMYDILFKFEEDQTETVVAIENNTYFGQTDRQTDTQTYYTQVILYLSNAMHCIGQITSLEKAPCTDAQIDIGHTLIRGRMVHKITLLVKFIVNVNQCLLTSLK